MHVYARKEFIPCRYEPVGGCGSEKVRIRRFCHAEVLKWRPISNALLSL
jgi:hypothetical protein